MPLISKDFSELNADSTARLQGLGFSDAAYTGTAVRNIIESADAHIADLYVDMKANLESQYLSKASTATLDALGLLVGCTRRAGEPDDNYRFRISKALTVTKKANLEAHLDALFALNNIRDVIVRPFTQGIGTVTFYLIAISGTIDASTQALAAATLQSISAAGAYTIVKTPTPVLLNLSGVLAGQGTSLQPAAAAAANAYIASLSMGDPFVKARLDQVVLNAAPAISDFTLLTLSTTDSSGATTQRLLGNYTPNFDEELQPGTILIS